MVDFVREDVLGRGTVSARHKVAGDQVRIIRVRHQGEFDMKDPSEIPAVAEPWFLAFNAKVSFRPIMNPEDLAKAGPSIGKEGSKRSLGLARAL